MVWEAGGCCCDGAIVGGDGPAADSGGDLSSLHEAVRHSIITIVIVSITLMRRVLVAYIL